MIPPIELPCPPMYLVSACTTMSAPCSIGRSRMGEGTVLSTISGTPCACAIFAKASTSATLPDGLPTVSMKIALVRSSMSLSNEAGSSPSAKRVSMPNCGSVWANRL